MIFKNQAYSSSHPDVQDWKVNGASDFNLGGLLFNDKSGFGAVDAYAAAIGEDLDGTKYSN